jgi:hypothetical protein
MKDIKSGYAYTCKHVPTGEEWYLLGIDVKGDRVCAAGWPPTIANLSDCTDIQEAGQLTPEELQHRINQFGHNWI